MSAGAGPVPFIQQARDGTFFVADEGREVLSRIRKRVHVVVVAGPYRSGKSYLLTKLLGKKGRGFEVSGTVNACTKGIWLWGEPIEVDGRTFVLMDTEGLNSTEQEANFDVNLLSLALLLSSYFVLNTQGNITETALEQLEMVVEVSRRIKIFADDDDDEAGATNADLARYFPPFLWILRDFALQLVDEDNETEITAREYLEKALRNQTGSARSRSKNSIRETIRGVFPNRDCETLVRPITDESKLRRLPELSDSALRPEFVAGIKRVRRKVFTEAPVKEVGGERVSGRALVGLADAYVQALNAGAAPTIETAWRNVMVQQAAEARSEALDHYNDAMGAAFPAGDDSVVLNDDELAKVHRRARRAAFKILKEYLLDGSDLADAEEALDAAMADRLERVDEVNALRSREQCRSALEEAWSRAGDGREVNSAADIELIFSDVKAEFDGLARGPAREAAAAAFFVQKRREANEKLFARQAELVADLDALRAHVEELEAALEVAERSAADHSKEAEDLLRELDQAKAEVDASAGRELDLRTELGQLRSNAAADADGLREDLAAAERRIKTLERDLERAVSALQEAEERLADAKADAAAAADSAVAGVEADLKAERKEARKVAKALAAAETRVGQLEAELEDVTATMAHSANKVDEELRRARKRLAEERERFTAEIEEQTAAAAAATEAAEAAAAAAAVGSSTSQENIETMTIAELKAFLGKHEVAIPHLPQLREVYLDLARPLADDGADRPAKRRKRGRK